MYVNMQKKTENRFIPGAFFSFSVFQFFSFSVSLLGTCSYVAMR
jgi:hypothetical protein